MSSFDTSEYSDHHGFTAALQMTETLTALFQSLTVSLCGASHAPSVPLEPIMKQIHAIMETPRNDNYKSAMSEASWETDEQIDVLSLAFKLSEVFDLVEKHDKTQQSHNDGTFAKLCAQIPTKTLNLLLSFTARLSRATSDTTYMCQYRDDKAVLDQIARLHSLLLKISTTANSCEVCLASDKLPEDIVQLACGDKWCWTCLKNFFLKATKSEELFPPKCCQQHIPIDLIAPMLSTEELQAYQLSSEEFSSENRVYCHDTKCGAFISSSQVIGDKATCVCGEVTCVHCHHNFHDGECARDSQLQATLQLAAQSNWKRCFRCRSVVELVMGCNHVTCPCGAHWCFECCSEWKTCACPQWNEQNLLAHEDREARRQMADQVPGRYPDARDRFLQFQRRRELLNTAMCRPLTHNEAFEVALGLGVVEPAPAELLAAFQNPPAEVAAYEHLLQTRQQNYRNNYHPHPQVPLPAQYVPNYRQNLAEPVGIREHLIAAPCLHEGRCQTVLLNGRAEACGVCHEVHRRHLFQCPACRDLICRTCHWSREQRRANMVRDAACIFLGPRCAR